MYRRKETKKPFAKRTARNFFADRKRCARRSVNRIATFVEVNLRRTGSFRFSSTVPVFSLMVYFARRTYHRESSLLYTKPNSNPLYTRTRKVIYYLPKLFEVPRCRCKLTVCMTSEGKTVVRGDERNYKSREIHERRPIAVRIFAHALNPK